MAVSTPRLTAGERLKKFMSPFLRMSTKPRNREGQGDPAELLGEQADATSAAPPTVSNLSRLCSMSIRRRTSTEEGPAPSPPSMPNLSQLRSMSTSRRTLTAAGDMGPASPTSPTPSMSNMSLLRRMSISRRMSTAEVDEGAVTSRTPSMSNLEQLHSVSMRRRTSLADLPTPGSLSAHAQSPFSATSYATPASPGGRPIPSMTGAEFGAPGASAALRPRGPRRLSIDESGPQLQPPGLGRMASRRASMVVECGPDQWSSTGRATDVLCTHMCPTPPSGSPHSPTAGSSGGGGVNGRRRSFMVHQTDSEQVAAMLARTLASNLAAAGGQSTVAADRPGSESWADRWLGSSSSCGTACGAVSSPQVNLHHQGSDHSSPLTLLSREGRPSTSVLESHVGGGYGHHHHTPHKNCSVPNLGNGSDRRCALPDINSPTSRMATPSAQFPPSSPTWRMSSMTTPSAPYSTLSPTRRMMSSLMSSSARVSAEQGGPFESGGGLCPCIVDGEGDEGAATFSAAERALTQLRSFCARQPAGEKVKAGHTLSSLEEVCAEHEEKMWQPIGAGSMKYRHHRVNK